MGKKYFFKAPYDRSAYISLRLESGKFTVTKDNRYIVATKPLTLREYYVAFGLGIPFRAYVKDVVELAVPNDLDSIAAAARRACRGVRRIFLSWRTIEAEDFNAAEEVEIIGNFVRRGIHKMLVRGYGEVATPYVCEDPDDCMWPRTLLTFLYEVVHEYKEWRYKEGDCTCWVDFTVKNIKELFSDPKNRHVIFISDADVNEIERLLKEEGFDVLRQCREAKARIRIKKASEGMLLIEC